MLLTSALHSWDEGGQLRGVGSALEIKVLNEKKNCLIKIHGEAP